MMGLKLRLGFIDKQAPKKLKIVSRDAVLGGTMYILLVVVFPGSEIPGELYLEFCKLQTTTNLTC